MTGYAANVNGDLSYWHEIKDFAFFLKCLKELYNFPNHNFVKVKQQTFFFIGLGACLV